MGCGCSKNRGNKRPLQTQRPIAPRTNPIAPRIQAAPPPVSQAMVSLPPPPNPSDAAAIRRIKQLNKEAVQRLTGR